MNKKSILNMHFIPSFGHNSRFDTGPPLMGQQVAATVQLNFSPASLALDAADELLFVGTGNGGPGVVYGIYLPNASIVGSVNVPGEPSSMAYSSATGLLYATSLPSSGVNNNIVVINTKANPITTSTIHVGSSSSANPFTIALNPVNGKGHTTNYKDQSVSVIDPSNNNSVTTIPIQTQYPELIAFDPGSGEVYVTAHGVLSTTSHNGTLTAIDPATNAVTATVTAGYFPYAVAVDPSSHNVYVGNITDGTVDVISPSQGYSVTNTISTGSSSQPYALVLDGMGRIYAALNNTNQVAVINPTQGYSVTKIAVGMAPQLITYDSGVNLVAVLNTGSNTVSYISPTSLSVAATVAVGSQGPYTFATITNGTYKGTAVANEASNNVSLIAD